MHLDSGKKMKEWDIEAGQRGLPIDNPEAKSKKKIPKSGDIVAAHLK